MTHADRAGALDPVAGYVPGVNIASPVAFRFAGQGSDEPAWPVAGAA